jgi:hypothetical protein
MMELNYWKTYWPLNEERCPCDVHLVEYIVQKAIRGRTVFHFGTGHHHIVGIKNLELDPPNEILGITASREEQNSYVDLVIENPLVGRYYKVLFADIYTLTPALLPRFDLVTLFHLCEFYTEANRAYGGVDDTAVLRTFVESMSPGGLVLFYNRSSAYREAAVLAREALQAGVLEAMDDYKSLKVYRKPT